MASIRSPTGATDLARLTLRVDGQVGDLPHVLKLEAGYDLAGSGRRVRVVLVVRIDRSEVHKSESASQLVGAIPRRRELRAHVDDRIGKRDLPVEDVEEFRANGEVHAAFFPDW